MSDEKNKGGRPPKDVDMEVLKNACRVGCTAEECAAILGVSPDTIDRRLKDQGWSGFADYFKTHFEKTKMSLRHAQLQAAIQGANPTMMIWLGKQYLGQRDKADLGLDGGLTINWAKDCEDV